MGLTYKDAGVDISRQDQALKRIKQLVGKTRTKDAAADIGAFGGAVAIDTARYPRPLLISSVDGVGTKLYIAQQADDHTSVGYDLVSHCVNDILTQGAAPLFFMDYISSSRLHPDTIVSIIEGMVDACLLTGCALVGGELAEMPGLYRPSEYDLVGSITGIVNADHVITGKSIREGDVIIGLPSLGLHTNGFSLARKVLLDQGGLDIDQVIPGLGVTVAGELLKKHKCYYPVVSPLLSEGNIKGVAHITGGGLLDNIPRILPDGLAAHVRAESWRPLPIFEYLREKGGISPKDAFQTFNMGIGLVLVVDAADENAVIDVIRDKNEDAFSIGHIIKGKGEVHIT